MAFLFAANAGTAGLSDGAYLHLAKAGWPGTTLPAEETVTKKIQTYKRVMTKVIPLHPWLDDVLASAISDEETDVLDDVVSRLQEDNGGRAVDEDTLAVDYYVREGSLIFDVYAPGEDS